MFLYGVFAVIVIIALRNGDSVIGVIKHAYIKLIDRRPGEIEKLNTISFKALPPANKNKAPAPVNLQRRPTSFNRTHSNTDEPISVPEPPKPMITSDIQKQMIADNIFAFKMQLLRKFPFYGDIVMKLEIVEDETVPTACTNGRYIRYNPNFFASMPKAQYCYVLMHEVMHALLCHPTRVGDRNPRLWNVAGDFVVNHMLNTLTRSFKQGGVEIEQPSSALVLPSYVMNRHSVETLYNELLEQNKDNKNGIARYTYKTYGTNTKTMIMKLPEDMVITAGLSEADKKEIEAAIKNLLMESGGKHAGTGTGDVWIPEELLVRKDSKKIPWKVLLQDYLEDGEYGEYSYFTPERKYIHMDLILPGPGERNSELGEIWAFIDDSGSITPDQMGEFLTQLYRILKEFSGTMHVAFWNTQVDAVYRNIQSYKEIDNIKPKGSGGTDVNCVFEFMKKENIKPEIMLILTDGYYGNPKEEYIKKSLRRNTIVVLTENGEQNMEDCKKIGKVAFLGCDKKQK